MEREGVSIAKVPFGCCIKEVDKCLQDLECNHIEKLREIKTKILSYKNENAKLKENIIKLEKQRCEKRHSDELMEYALNRFEQFAPIILSSIEKQTVEIQSKYLVQEVMLDKKIEETEKEVKETQQELYRVLKEML